MDGIKMGGIYYGGDVQKAMEEAHRIIIESVEKVFKDDATESIVRTALDEYELVFTRTLKEF